MHWCVKRICGVNVTSVFRLLLGGFRTSRASFKPTQGWLLMACDGVRGILYESQISDISKLRPNWFPHHDDQFAVLGRHPQSQISVQQSSFGMFRRFSLWVLQLYDVMMMSCHQNILLNLSQEVLKGVQPSTTKVYLIKWLVSVISSKRAFVFSLKQHYPDRYNTTKQKVFNI